MTMRLCPSDAPLSRAAVTTICFSYPGLVLASLGDGRLAVWKRPATINAEPVKMKEDEINRQHVFYNHLHPPLPSKGPTQPSWSESKPALFTLLRSRMPFPRAGRKASRDDAAETTNISTVSVPWGHISIAGPQPALEPDELTTSNIYFSFRGGNKVYRTALPEQSLVGGYFGGAPVEQFAVQREPISCISLSARASGAGPGKGHGVSRKPWSSVGVLGTGGADGVAMVWDTAHSAGDLGEHNILTVMAHNGLPVNDMCFVAGNHLAVTASSDDAVRVWRIADGTLLQSMFTGEATVNVLRCRPQGLSLSGDKSSSIVLAGTSTGSVFCWHLEHERHMPDGARNLAEGAEPASCSHRLVALSDHSAHSIMSIVLLDEGHIMVSSENGDIRLFRLETQVASDSVHLELEHTSNPFGTISVIGFWDGVPDPSCAAFAADSSSALRFAQFIQPHAEAEDKSWHVDEILFTPKVREPKKVVFNEPNVDEETIAAEMRKGARGSIIKTHEEGLRNEVSNLTKDKEPERRTVLPLGPTAPTPRKFLPQAEEHPILHFKSWPSIAKETRGMNAETADRWASGRFKADGELDGQSDLEPVYIEDTKGKSRKKFYNEISSQFANPERVEALASVTRRPEPSSRVHVTSPGEHRSIGYHGGDPPYFSGTVDPISDLQEPTLHSTKSIRKQIDVLNNMPFEETDPEGTDCLAYNETLKDRNHLLNFKLKERRYEGLIPVDVAPPPPPRKIAKQIDPAWAEEVSSKNKPEIDDIPIPQLQIPTTAKRPGSEPVQKQRGLWAQDAWKFRASNMRSRYRAYFP